MNSRILVFCSLALSTLKTNKGYALADILTELHRYVHKSNEIFSHGENEIIFQYFS